MKKYFVKKLKDKSAQDMIEFACVLPILMAVFLFIFTAGQMIYNKQVAFNMAYQGCRTAVINNRYNAQSAAYERAKEYLPQTIAVKDFDLTVELDENSTAWTSLSRAATNSAYTGQYSTQYCITTVTLYMQTLFPIKGIMGEECEITASTKMAIEYNPNLEYKRTEVHSLH